MTLIKTISLKPLGDNRGSLVSLESNNNIPFDIKRVYYIFDTKEGVSRGYHAHKNLKQVAICVKGSCRFILDDGINPQEDIVLNSSTTGLIIEGMTWREMHDFSDDCVLIVLADSVYDAADYVRDYQEFMKMVSYDS